jgi:hypothetical protein
MHKKLRMADSKFGPVVLNILIKKTTCWQGKSMELLFGKVRVKMEAVMISMANIMVVMAT